MSGAWGGVPCIRHGTTYNREGRARRGRLLALIRNAIVLFPLLTRIYFYDQKPCPRRGPVSAFLARCCLFALHHDLQDPAVGCVGPLHSHSCTLWVSSDVRRLSITLKLRKLLRQGRGTRLSFSGESNSMLCLAGGVRQYMSYSCTLIPSRVQKYYL